ncbi:hypothetical protein EAW52_24135 [Pseudomonas sp. LTJR-52]|uniref:hypothetical protein n=1 Tax=Pseudomonas sp. LTJR-52 TaxID=2479392 RepID=UPI000EFD11DE|nr:hypothetical protein [Pseudomonas sp. LTJR-52]AYN96801.1 hypothetical protein EAW52_24135 [Pseudomonas sp. LTJR-52]
MSYDINTKRLLDRVMGTASASAKRAALTIETRAVTAKDAIRDRADSFRGSASKVYAGAIGTIDLITTLGFTFSAIAAPVPTAIGIALIYLFESQYKLRLEETEIAVASRQRQRKQARVVALLKKHGAIPESAILETAWVRVSINSRTGEIRGAILQGQSKGTPLEQISMQELEDLIEHAPDADTRSLLEAYLSFRIAQTSANQESQHVD